MFALILKYVVHDFCSIMKLGTILWWVGFCTPFHFVRSAP